MGADLYIEPGYTKACEAARPEFDAAVAARDKAFPRGTRGEGPEYERLQKAVDDAYEKMYPEEWYFRDSYNGTAVMWRLNISWWNDVTPMLTKAGYLSREKCLELADRVEKTELKLLTETEAKEQYLVIDKDNTLETWNKYYQEKKDRLVKFLRRATEPGNKLYCSL